MYKNKTIYAFIFCFLFLLFSAPFLLKIKIMLFIPFLILFIQSCSFLSCLWLSFVIGFLMDLLSSYQIGLFSLSYVVTSAFLYSQKKHFFEDNTLHFSLFASLYSFIFSLIFTFLFCIFGAKEAFTGKWILTDLLIMPFLDGIYSAFSIACLRILGRVERKIKLFFLKAKRR